MSDLISRSDLIAKIDNDIRDTENYICLFSSNRVALSSQLNTLKTYKAIIENQPTAFDKEKVVEQLLDMRLIRVEQCHGDYEIEVMTESNFDDAIDIVKRGGIE